MLVLVTPTTLPLIAVEAPVGEEGFGPFGPTGEPIGTSRLCGLRGSFGGINGKETGETAFMIE